MATRRHIRSTVVALAALVLAARVSAQAGAGRAVLEHHGGPRRDGVYVDAPLTRDPAALHLDAAFRAAVPGAIYAQPLYVPGRGGPDLVVAATEANHVAAFDARSGATVWSRRLGDPVPVSKLPCGNIDPLGVTGTPVADAAQRTLYLDAMTTADGGATKRHLVFALSQRRPVHVSPQRRRPAVSLMSGALRRL